MKRLWIALAALIAADQALKLAVRSTFAPGQSAPLLPPVVYLTYVQNTGMAFGLFRGFPYVFVALAVVVAAWIVRELASSHDRDPWTRWALVLVLGGAIGNLIDRVRLGFVTDFIDLRVWPVFNLADSCITVGVALLVLHSLGWLPQGRSRDGKAAG